VISCHPVNSTGPSRLRTFRSARIALSAIATRGLSHQTPSEADFEFFTGNLQANGSEGGSCRAPDRLAPATRAAPEGQSFLYKKGAVATTGRSPHARPTDSSARYLGV
jgi:hypothetical protein